MEEEGARWPHRSSKPAWRALRSPEGSTPSPLRRKIRATTDSKTGHTPNSRQTGCLVVKAISIAVKDGARQPVVRLAEFVVVLAGRDEPQA